MGSVNFPKSDKKSAHGPQLQTASAPVKKQTWRTCLVRAQLDNITLILMSSKATKFQTLNSAQTSLHWHQYRDKLQWWRPQLTRDTKYKPEMKCSNMRLKNNSLRKKKKTIEVSFLEMMAHINSNPLATEFNPSITQRAVANLSHRLQIVVSPNLSLSFSVTHTYTVSRQICRLLYLSGTDAYLFLILTWLQAVPWFAILNWH